MSFWKDYAPQFEVGGPMNPPLTEKVRRTNETLQRERLLSAYTDSMERLQLEMEEAEEKRGKSGQTTSQDNHISKYAHNDVDDHDKSGCVGRVQQCIQLVDENLVPYKLLYVFTRGGEACVALYLSVYGLQIGLNPTKLALIFALPFLISSVTTPLCGFIADKFRCRREMLLCALCLWVFFSLSIFFVPAPAVAQCGLARKQFQETIARVNFTSTDTSSLALDSPLQGHAMGVAGLVRNYDESRSSCMISDNATTPARKPSWLTILHVINTPWTEETEACYPGGRFWGNAKVTGGPDIKGPSNTFKGWMFERNSLESSFNAIFALITVAGVMQGLTSSMIDTEVLHILGPRHSHEYGWQRAFGNAGYAIYIFSVTIFINLTEWTMSHCQVTIVIEDYRLAMIIFMGTTTCAIGLLFAYCIKYTRSVYPYESNICDLRRVVSKVGPALMVPILCFMGACEGAMTVFLPYHLTTIGTSVPMIKSSRIIVGVSELLLAFHLSQMIQTRGHGVLVTLGALGYLVCFLAYALIPSAIGILLVGVIRGMSRALTWNVVVARLSPEVYAENLASLQGCLTGTYMLGAALGAMVAGFGVKQYGAPITFFCFAFACLIIAVAMVIGLSRNNEIPETVKTKPKRHKSIPSSIRYKPIPSSIPSSDLSETE